MILKKKIIIICILLITITISVNIGFYIHALNSPYYKFAENFIKSNKNIEEKLGVLISYNLKFNEYSFSSVGRFELIKMKIFIDGEINDGDLYLEMNKKEDSFNIIKCKLILDENNIIDIR